MDNTLLILVGILVILYVMQSKKKDTFVVESAQDGDLFLLTSLIFNPMLPPDQREKANEWTRTMILPPGEKLKDGIFSIRHDSIGKIENILRQYAKNYGEAGFILPQKDKWLDV